MPGKLEKQREEAILADLRGVLETRTDAGWQAQVVADLQARLEFVSTCLDHAPPPTAREKSQVLLLCTPDTPLAWSPLGNRTTIGCGPDNDLVISLPGVSRNHACIRQQPDGRRQVEDLASSNGTYLNGSRIANDILKNGDILTFGSAYAIFFSHVPDQL